MEPHPSGTPGPSFASSTATGVGHLRKLKTHNEIHFEFKFIVSDLDASIASEESNAAVFKEGGNQNSSGKGVRDLVGIQNLKRPSVNDSIQVISDYLTQFSVVCFCYLI